MEHHSDSVGLDNYVGKVILFWDCVIPG
jgi:hypothetical protein